MANGHSIIPLDDKQIADPGVVQYLAEDMVFFPENLPRGRFPTLSELRDAIHELDYELEETHDWYVTSKDDHTEIWFRDDSSAENSPIEFWFRRGGIIVLDIAQAIANRCGSCFVVDHGGAPIVFLVPDAIFSATTQPLAQRGFVAHLVSRFPTMIERLAQASLDETQFILSQIRQALRQLDYFHEHDFFRAAQQGLASYLRLLTHDDVRVRFMAFDLVTLFRDGFYINAESILLSITNEPVSSTKALMIDALEKLIVRDATGIDLDPATKSILDLLLTLVDNAEEASQIRLSATNLLARAQPGLLSASMRSVLIDVLTHPEHYAQRLFLQYDLIEIALKSIENLMLNHRLEILLVALPQITVAPYAHDVLRNLLDHTFFGAIRFKWMSSLPDTYLAERPPVDESKMQENLSRSWLYPTNPTKLTAIEISSTQRLVLETVLALDTPWMVHSNLLEKYGFPPTRALTRVLLDIETPNES